MMELNCCLIFIMWKKSKYWKKGINRQLHHKEMINKLVFCLFKHKKRQIKYGVHPSFSEFRVRIVLNWSKTKIVNTYKQGIYNFSFLFRSPKYQVNCSQCFGICGTFQWKIRWLMIAWLTTFLYVQNTK